jgi:hypothetical protein
VLGHAVGDRSLPDAQDVPIAQAVAPGDALPVDERAVAREAVVGDRPLVPQPLELGVQAAVLGVPLQGDVVARAAPDGRAAALRVEQDEALAAVAVAEHEERVATPFGLDALAQLRRRRRVRRQG